MQGLAIEANKEKIKAYREANKEKKRKRKRTMKLIKKNIRS